MHVDAGVFDALTLTLVLARVADVEVESVLVTSMDSTSTSMTRCNTDGAIHAAAADVCDDLILKLMMLAVAAASGGYRR